MKSVLALLLASTALVGCSSTDDVKAPVYAASIEPGDLAAVIAALEDYVDGFTRGQPELLERSLSPMLAKKGYRRPAPGEPYGDAVPLSYEDALALAARRGNSSETMDTFTSSVQVFEVADKTAAGKVTAFWGIDYVHLVKEEDGRWKIHHVIWQTEPEPAAK
ncbi:MAG: nuclear transport factor 2 family protein [Planctomycetota bacterium]